MISDVNYMGDGNPSQLDHRMVYDDVSSMPIGSSLHPFNPQIIEDSELLRSKSPGIHGHRAMIHRDSAH